MPACVGFDSVRSRISAPARRRSVKTRVSSLIDSVPLSRAENTLLRLHTAAAPVYPDESMRTLLLLAALTALAPAQTTTPPTEEEKKGAASVRENYTKYEYMVPMRDG